MSKRLKINSYIAAINRVRELCENQELIIKDHIIKEYKVPNEFFWALEQINAIEVGIRGTVREGSMFVWKYKLASNESNSNIAIRVMGLISDKRKEYYNKVKKGLTNKRQPKINQLDIRDEAKLAQKVKTFAAVVNGEAVVQEQTVLKKQPLSRALFEINGNGLSKSELIAELTNAITDGNIQSCTIEIKYAQ